MEYCLKKTHINGIVTTDITHPSSNLEILKNLMKFSNFENLKKIFVVNFENENHNFDNFEKLYEKVSN